MNKFVLLLSVLSLSSVAEGINPEKKYSFGVGKGALYSGIGVNFSFVSKSDLKYISTGCTEYSSINGASCGFGVGWIKTDLFDFDNNNHGIGIYATLVGKEYESISDYGVLHHNQERDVYALGLSYNYFMNGINHSGFVFGASMHVTNAKYDGRYGAFLQAGYQF